MTKNVYEEKITTRNKKITINEPHIHLRNVNSKQHAQYSSFSEYYKVSFS